MAGRLLAVSVGGGCGHVGGLGRSWAVVLCMQPLRVAVAAGRVAWPVRLCSLFAEPVLAAAPSRPGCATRLRHLPPSAHRRLLPALVCAGR